MIGKVLIFLVAVFTSVSLYLANLNVTHIYNPASPPHAKLHNAQTMVLGTVFGFLTIYCLKKVASKSGNLKLLLHIKT